MTCVELQESLADVEDGSSVEQSAHLRSCPECAALLRELNLIVASAAGLRASDEPSPRVWNSIEIALRQEGFIRPQATNHGNNNHRPSVLPGFSSRWEWARWLVPAAAVLLVVVGVHQWRASSTNLASTNPATQVATVTAPVAAQHTANPSGLNDDDLLQEVAQNSPAMQSEYEENLRRVNAYISDEQNIVNESPNDEDARRSLMDAYQQKSMLFEMAMDHPQP